MTMFDMKSSAAAFDKIKILTPREEKKNKSVSRLELLQCI